jgi:hypothetical protein
MTRCAGSTMLWVVSDVGADHEMRRRLRCRHCQDVIGAYEPMVLDMPEGGYETSLAAEPWLGETEYPCFHHSCYAEVRGGVL